jgi:hypothetical protein
MEEKIGGSKYPHVFLAKKLNRKEQNETKKQEEESEGISHKGQEK